MSSSDRAKEKAKEARRKEYSKARKNDPTTVEEQVDVEELKKTFTEKDWGPSWAVIEFDANACLSNVTKAGKAKDGFYAPAGTILPLGGALSEQTVLKYGGYFPPGTSFPGGVMIPLHARMVNILPQATRPDPVALAEESICVVQ